MTLDELDALIEACPAPAMIVLTSQDWQSTMTDPAGAGSRRETPTGGISYRDLPVLIVWPGGSRVLTAEQVAAEQLDGLVL